MDYDWKVYPVIHLDMTSVRASTPTAIAIALNNLVMDLAEHFEVSIKREKEPGITFENFWKKVIHANLQVVVLIDEYDVALQGFFDNPAQLQAVQQLMHDFYVRLKTYSNHIRFLMFTGVSKFAKLSLFSGLNNLRDISMSHPYETLLGFTEAELDVYFREHIQAFAEQEKVSYDEMRDVLRNWYNGYHFSRNMKGGVYNPVSVGLALTEREVRNYWIQTGNARVIMERLRKAQKIPANLDGIVVSSESLEVCDSITMPLNSLLYQGGYLTIKDVDEVGTFILGVPNQEVRLSLTSQYLQGDIDWEADAYLSESAKAALALSKGDFLRAVELFRSAIADLPFSWLIRDEGAVKTAFLSFFYSMPTVRVSTEKEIQRGRLDAVVETQAGVYIFEFKYQQTAQVAHDQVIEKGYAEPYRAHGKPIFAIGLNYTPDGENRGIDEAVVSQL